MDLVGVFKYGDFNSGATRCQAKARDFFGSMAGHTLCVWRDKKTTKLKIEIERYSIYLYCNRGQAGSSTPELRGFRMVEIEQSENWSNSDH